ncbi:MAG: EF-hand domain-containing protein [Zoogloea sp.]|nr:EF-hand domain-containing protein [Zoogloea sp.]
MVSSIGSSGMVSMAGMQRPDPSRMASNVFSKLDTKGQGFIEESDLQSAFSQLTSASSGSAESDSAALFKVLDGDSDGKVTESEFSSSMQKLADALESQAFGSRMAGVMPPPPPPPEGDDAGFTQEEPEQPVAGRSARPTASGPSLFPRWWRTLKPPMPMATAR